MAPVDLLRNSCHHGHTDMRSRHSLHREMGRKRVGNTTFVAKKGQRSFQKNTAFNILLLLGSKKTQTQTYNFAILYRNLCIQTFTVKGYQIKIKEVEKPSENEGYCIFVNQILSICSNNDGTTPLLTSRSNPFRSLTYFLITSSFIIIYTLIARYRTFFLKSLVQLLLK